MTRLGNTVPVEAPLRPAWGQVLAGSAVFFLADTQSGAVVAVTPLPRKLGSGHQYVQQEAGSGVGFVRVDALTGGSEPGLMPQTRWHQPVKLRAAGFRPAPTYAPLANLAVQN